MKNKIKQFALCHYDSIVNFVGAVTVSFLFLSGIGRYRVVVVYATYALINSLLSFTNPGRKVHYIVLPATLTALYFDIQTGPLLPLFAKNYLIIAIIIVLVSDDIMRRYAKWVIERITEGQVFVVCPSCKFNNKDLINKCLSCSYQHGDKLAATLSNMQEPVKNIPMKVLRMVGLHDDESILFHMKLFPHKSVIKNGQRQIRTNFIITTERLMLLDYFYISGSWREKDNIPLMEIVSVEGKLNKIYLSREPFLIITTASKDVYEIVFKRFGKFKEIITSIIDILKKTNPNIDVYVTFPSPANSWNEEWKL